MSDPRTAFATEDGLRLGDLKPGDTVLVQPRQACLIHGLATVEADSEGDLFIHCRQGFHYLELFQGAGGLLVGLSRGEAQS
jgi:hypothetical protein